MEYYVIRFDKPPTEHRNCHGYAYVPSTWVLARVDNQILFRYPKKKKSVTEKRIEEGQKVSEKWPMYFETVLFRNSSLDKARYCAEIMQESCPESRDTQSVPVNPDQSECNKPPNQDNSNGKRKKRRATTEDSTDEEDDNSTNSTSTKNTLKSNEVQKISASIQTLVKEMKQQNDCFEKLKTELEEIRNVSFTNAVTLKKMQSEILNAENHCADNNTAEDDDQEWNKAAKSVKRTRKSVDKQQSQATPKKNSKWTVRYHNMAPGLQELVEGTGVYIDSERLANCREISEDGPNLARLLMVEIFTKEALATCSLTGGRPAGCSRLDKKPIKPGLDEHARNVLLDFVEDEWNAKKVPGYRRYLEKSLSNRLFRIQQHRGMKSYAV